MNSEVKICRYCKNEFSSGVKEHVFPKGLGGSSIYLDCVCEQCNTKFSAYETELMRESPLAFMISVEGVEGYKPSNEKPAPFKAPILLSFDEDKKVVYEIGQHYPLQNFVRPQIIQINGSFYIEGDTKQGLKDLVKKFNQWKKEVCYVVVKVTTDTDSTLQWIEFIDKETHFESRIGERKEKQKVKLKLIFSPTPTNYILFFLHAFL